MATYKELLAQAEELSRQAEEMRLKEVQGVISDIKAKMEDYGITIEDLQSKSRGSSAGKPRGKVANKYAKDGKTWTGRGMQPSWVKEHIAAGGNLDDLLIDKSSNDKA